MRAKSIFFVVALLASSIAASATEPNDIADAGVFRMILRQPGDDGAKAYSIPGLATTPQGTLLAVFDIRHGALLFHL